MIHGLDRQLSELRSQRLGGIDANQRRAMAERLLSSARAMPMRIIEAAVLVELADACLTDDPAAAQTHARAAQALIDERSSPNRVALALAIEADALAMMGELQHAHRLLQRAVGLARLQRARMAEPVLRATSMRERIRICDRATQVAFAVGDLACAIATAELARPSLDPDPPLLEIADVQAALSEDEAVVAYTWIGPDRLLVATIEPDHYDAKPKLVAPEAMATLDHLAAFVRNADLNGWQLSRDWAVRLDALVPALLPDIVQAVLRRRRRISILGHHALHAVPFGLLRVEGTRLGLLNPISIVPNLRSLVRTVDTSRKRAAVIVGIGTYNEARATPAFLSAARTIAARREVDGLPTSLLSQQDAKSQLLAMGSSGRLSECGLLMLACHGTSVQGDAPDRSFLLLGADRLDAGTIATLPMQADLVMLVACCSGQRAVGGMDFTWWPGDDLFGLQAALWQGGSRQVVGSLWNADVDAAATMAQAIHDRWVQGASAAEAVHAGAHMLIQRPLHAVNHDWATFVALTFGRAAPYKGGQ